MGISHMNISKDRFIKLRDHFFKIFFKTTLDFDVIF